MSKKTQTQQNDEYLAMMRAKGWDWVFLSELPYPKVTHKCSLILKINGRQVLIRDEVVA